MWLNKTMLPKYSRNFFKSSIYFLLFGLILFGCSAADLSSGASDGMNGSFKTNQQLQEIGSLIKEKHYDKAINEVDRLISRNDNLPIYHLVKARALAKKESIQSALAYLTTQIEKHPTETGFLAARGQFLLENRYLESARDDFQAAYQKNFRTLDILKVLADIAQDKGKLKEGLDIVNEALQIDGNDHVLWYKRARLELRLFRVSESQTSILKAIDVSPNEITYHQFYIEILTFLKQRQEINQHIQKIYGQFPDNSWVAMQYAAILVENRDSQQAKDVLENVLQKSPREYLVRFQLATILASEKKWPEAIDYFKSGLIIEPKSSWAKVQLSKVYLQSGDVTAALGYLNEARKEESRDLFVYQTLAKIYNSQNDTYEAERIILEGLSINDKYLPLILEYANILEKRGKYGESIKAYEEALLLDKSNHVIIGRLANFYRLTKNYQKSHLFFQKAINLKPAASWLRAYYVELLVEEDKWQPALEELKTMEQLSPDDYWLHAKKALILDELEKHDLAFESITRAISLNPKAMWLKEIEGQILENLGRHKQAGKAFQVALNQSPDSSYLLTRLGYSQLQYDRKSALKSVKSALDTDDFDISTIELYLYLQGNIPKNWGFKTDSLEFQTYEKIIQKKYTAAESGLAQLKKRSSRHTPFLRYFLSYLKRSKNYEIKLDQSALKSLKSHWHYFYLGISAQKNRESETAKTYYQKALKLDPDNHWIMVKLAFTYQLLHEHKKAIKLLEKYVNKQSEDGSTWVLLRLALNYDLDQQYGEAENVYKTIIEKNPNDNIALNNLAWMYLTTKNPAMQKIDAALDLALKAVNISPTAANLDTLANAYYQKKEYSRALKTIERALDKDRQSLDDFKKTKKKILKAIQSNTD